MQEALETAMAELVLGPELDLDDALAVEAWLGRHGVSEDDAEVLRAGELRRLAVYRGLVRGTLREAVQASIPLSMQRLGPIFDEYFDRFLRERGPRTHYLRDVTTELLAFCAPLFEADPRVPDFLLDLARHEALHIEISAAPPRAPALPGAALDLDAGLEFIEAARVVHYRHAVHRLGPEDASSVPERADTHLFVYRSPEHEVRMLELTLLAAAILERLGAGASLRDALLDATRLHGASLDEALLTGTARVLADLADRGAILGVRAPNVTHPTADESDAEP